jgi:hypothetical protein
MRLSEMIERFCVLVQDPHQDKFRSPEPEVFLNQALEELQNIAVRAGALHSCSSTQYSVSANSTGAEEDDLPTDFRRGIRVEQNISGGVNIRCNEVDFRDYIDDNVPVIYWEAIEERTTPLYYFRDDKIGFVRPWQDFTMVLYYDVQWSTMREGETECPAPLPFHSLVISKAASIARSMDGMKPSPQLDAVISQQEALFLSFMSKRSVQGPIFAE